MVPFPIAGLRRRFCPSTSSFFLHFHPPLILPSRPCLFLLCLILGSRPPRESRGRPNLHACPSYPRIGEKNFLRPPSKRKTAEPGTCPVKPSASPSQREFKLVKLPLLVPKGLEISLSFNFPPNVTHFFKPLSCTRFPRAFFRLHFRKPVGGVAETKTFFRHPDREIPTHHNGTGPVDGVSCWADKPT